MFGVQARDDLTATEWDGHDVGLQVGSVLVENELVVLDSAPALPPAAIGEHVQVACEGTEATFSASWERQGAGGHGRHTHAQSHERSPHSNACGTNPTHIFKCRSYEQEELSLSHD